MSKDDQISENEDNVDEKAKLSFFEYLKLDKAVNGLLITTIPACVVIIVCVFGMLWSLSSGPKNTVDFGVFGLFAAIILALAVWIPIENSMSLFRSLLFGRKNKTNVLHVMNKFVRRSYLTNFEIVNAEGDSPEERLFNHLSLVFPDVKKINEGRIKKNMSIKKYQSGFNLSPLRNYDLVILGNIGYFIIKIFKKKISFNDVKKVVNHIRIQDLGYTFFGPRKIYRLLIVGKEYDDEFYTYEISKKIKELKRRFNVDLILEEEDLGYSTIWIDEQDGK